MTEKTKKRRRLTREILGVFALCFVLSLLLFFFLGFFTISIVEEYCFGAGIELDEDMLYGLDTFVLKVSLAVSAVFFTVLFTSLFGERIAYIGTITGGVGAMQRGEFGYKVPVKGNNELTALAEAVNYLSETEQKIKEKEKKLNAEKEELVRTLSHDIRTPLTSIISYTELFSAKGELSAEEQKEYFALVRKKSAQIKELTDILLDGGKRETEYFSDARLLMEQLACEFEEMLEDEFAVVTDLSALPAFSGSFSVQELRRVFDNLASNVRKYAHAGENVELSLAKDEKGLIIRQKNSVREREASAESYRMGLSSIRRTAQNYGGGVEITDENGFFEITVLLSDF